MLDGRVSGLRGSVDGGRGEGLPGDGDRGGDDVRRTGDAPSQAVGAGAVQAVGGVAVGVARLAVDLRAAVLLVQVVVLGRLGAALHRHRDVGLGGGARRHGRRGNLLTGRYACGD